MKVLAGDFSLAGERSHYNSSTVYFPMNGGKSRYRIGMFNFPDPGNEGFLSYGRIMYRMTAVSEMQELTEENKVKVLGAAGWGAVGALVAGPMGLLAGMVLGGRGSNMVISVTFKDGRKALLQVDATTWTNMLADYSDGQDFRAAAEQMLNEHPGSGVSLEEVAPQSGTPESLINKVAELSTCLVFMGLLGLLLWWIFW